MTVHRCKNTDAAVPRRCWSRAQVRIKPAVSQAGIAVCAVRSEEAGPETIVAGWRLDPKRSPVEMEEALPEQSEERLLHRLSENQELLTAARIGRSRPGAARSIIRSGSRLESLRNLAERYDGYGNSIRRVMEQLVLPCRGSYGVVADLLEVGEGV